MYVCLKKPNILLSISFFRLFSKMQSLEISNKTTMRHTKVLSLAVILQIGELKLDSNNETQLPWRSRNLINL